MKILWVNKITKQYKKQNITRYSICFHLHTIKISACEHVKHKWISLDLTCQNRPTESSYVWCYLNMIKPQILYITLVLLSTANKQTTVHVWSVNNLVISQTLKYNNRSYTKKQGTFVVFYYSCQQIYFQGVIKS